MPLVAGEMFLGVLAAAIGRVVEERCGSRPAPEGLVVAHIGPQSPRAALAPGEHGNSRVVGVDAFGGEDMLGGRIDQRHQRRRTRADPVSQCRYVEIDAFVGVDVALPVERQMRPVLGEQDLRQEVRPSTAACDRMRWCRRLRDGLAFAARKLLAHVAYHLPLRRHVLQRLGDVLAELPQAPAAAGTAGRCRMHDALAR